MKFKIYLEDYYLVIELEPKGIDLIYLKHYDLIDEHQGSSMWLLTNREELNFLKNLLRIDFSYFPRDYIKVIPIKNNF